MEPCEGLELEPGSLIELLVPVYGLMDAPMEWHVTVTEELTKLGFRKCLLEPFWWTRRGSAGALQMVLIEVDDFLIGSTGREDMRALRKQLSERIWLAVALRIFFIQIWIDSTLEYESQIR